MGCISIDQLAQWQAAGQRFSLLDVRRAPARLGAARQIPGSRWLDPEGVASWQEQLARDRPLVLYCAHGQEISQGITADLEAMGLDARYLVGGYAAWLSAGQATQELAD
jgi:thiosulfate sulfurtransferase